jgi:hypothetical protein
MRLPNGDRAELGTKLEDYALNMLHREGRHKARAFESVLGITAGSADVLRRALRFPLSTAKGTGTVVSVWIVRHGEDFPRLTTCYIV